MGMPQQALHIVGGLVTDNPSPGLKVIEGDWPLDIDADGVMPAGSTKRVIVCDLAHMLSYRLGKQIPQTATFRINHLQIGLRNVDDVNDNDGPNYFAGTWEWYAPTKHRVDAIQAYRKWAKTLKEDLSGDAVEFSALYANAESDDYRGLRFGWHNPSDVDYATSGNSTNPFAIVDMFEEYNDGLENDGLPTKNRALWDRKLGRSNHLGWTAVCNNGEFVDQLGPEDDPINTAMIRDGVWTAPSGHCIEVVGGLMLINIYHSNTDTVQSVDDDFNLRVSIGISGWSAF